jgi:hypothetical protein
VKGQKAAMEGTKMLYLTISEGASAATAVPVIASKDPAILKAVITSIAERLGRQASLADDQGVASRLRAAERAE